MRRMATNDGLRAEEAESKSTQIKGPELCVGQKEGR